MWCLVLVKSICAGYICRHIQFHYQSLIFDDVVFQIKNERNNIFFGIFYGYWGKLLLKILVKGPYEY